MAEFRTFIDTWALRQVGTPVSRNAEATLDWVNITGFRRAVFLPNVADLTDDLVLTVYQATDSAGTSAKAVVTASGTVQGTFANGTNEGMVAGLEVLADSLDEGFNFVSLNFDPAAATIASVTCILGDAYYQNETDLANTVANNVAFTTGGDV